MIYFYNFVLNRLQIQQKKQDFYANQILVSGSYDYYVTRNYNFSVQKMAKVAKEYIIAIIFTHYDKCTQI